MLFGKPIIMARGKAAIYLNNITTILHNIRKFIKSFVDEIILVLII